jgi:GntR family transcriptional repressor for pyruvate dehydrogenase complex
MEEQSHSFGDPAAFVEADVGFHLRLAEAARNTALRDVLAGVQALLRVWIGRVIAAGNRDLSYREHIPILEAVERGDPAAAQAAMEAHMSAAAGRLELALAATLRTGPDAEEAPGSG